MWPVQLDATQSSGLPGPPSFLGMASGLILTKELGISLEGSTSVVKWRQAGTTWCDCCGPTPVTVLPVPATLTDPSGRCSGWQLTTLVQQHDTLTTTFTRLDFGSSPRVLLYQKQPFLLQRSACFTKTRNINA